MIVHQVYAHIYNEEIKNVLVCENYETANNLAKCIYGEDAIAVDILQYKVGIGDKYINNIFYNTNSETGEETKAKYIPTQEQKVATLESNVSKLQADLNPTLDVTTCTMNDLITYTVQQFSEVCSSIIYNGSDIETEKGVKHFSYNEKDQTNLSSALNLALITMMDIPYHADGEDCCLWSAHDIINIYCTNELLKTHQTTYCNLMNGLIRSAKSKEDILSISYGDTLPAEKQKELDLAVQQAQSVFNTLIKSNT